MGICLHNTKYSMDMGYGTFYSLRCRIASLLDTEFGENYAKLSRCLTKEQFAENDKVANEIINRKNLNESVVDFLYASDCEGKITPTTCKEIYNIVKDYDDDYVYGYIGANNSFKYFKDMLNYSCRYRANIVWS